jgi:hypothetical protein
MLPLGEFTVNKRRRDMGVRAASFEVMRKIRANAGLLRNESRADSYDWTNRRVSIWRRRRPISSLSCSACQTASRSGTSGLPCCRAAGRCSGGTTNGAVVQTAVDPAATQRDLLLELAIRAEPQAQANVRTGKARSG